jgi:hypothetical protein
MNPNGLFVSGSGLVGVGTTPSIKLSVRAADAPTAPTLGISSGHFIIGNGASTISYGLMFGVNGDGHSWIQSQRVDGTATAYNILLNPQGGNVGIGTTTPASFAQLHLNKAGNTGMFISNTTGNCGGYLFAGGLSGLELQSVDSGNTDARKLMLQPYGGNVLIGTSQADPVSANVTGIAFEGTLGSGKFSRGNNASLDANRFGSDGELIRTYRGGTQVGSISVTGSNTAYNTTFSDINKKKNFEDWTENVLDNFVKINPQLFNYINEQDGAEKSKGFIAQQMIDKFKEAYSKTDDGFYIFNPSGMVVYLMKAIQELNTKLNQQQQTINSLINR